MLEQIGTRSLSLVEPDDREGDDWDYIQSFAEAINKKFALEIMRQTRHSARS